MFTIDDDFDVDEDFLESAFEVESSISKNSKINDNARKSTESVSPKHLREISNVKNGYNSDIRTAECSKNAEFLELWNSNEDKLFFSKSPSKSANPKNLLDTTRAVSPLGLKSEVITRSYKNVRTRRFPGPAGLLPERTANTSFAAAEELYSTIEKDDETNTEYEDKEVLSQASSKVFEDPGGAWKTMMEDLGSHGAKLLSTINLATVRVKQAKIGFKVPLLAVCIHNIDCALPDPSLLLKDHKDEMHGTLHRDVWDDWKGDIVVGSVLVLRNAGVISAGISSRKYFLNITANNIVTIYSPKHDKGIKITQIQTSSGLDTSQILEEWERVMTQTRQQQLGSDLHQSSFSSPSSIAGLGTPLFCSSSPISPHTAFSPPVRPSFKPRIPLQQQRQSFGSPNFRQRQPTASQNLRLSPSIQSVPGQSLSSKNLPKQPSRQFTASRPSTPQQSFHRPPHSANNRMPVSKTPFSSSPSLANNYFNQVSAFQKNNTSNQISIGVPNKSKPPAIGAHFNLPNENTNFHSKPSGSMAPHKKPKMSNETDSNLKLPTSIFSVSSEADKSIVDSVLDGIDTDLFFDDF